MITDIPRDSWNAAAAGRLPDLSHEYLTFREHLEAGEAIVLTVDGEDGPAGAVHGVVTTEANGLFSHPWKLLAGEQFGRFESGEDPARETHAELVRAVDGELGNALTVRAYDTSEFLLPRPEVAGLLVRGLQDAVRDGRAGAVVLPYVRPGDEVLRAALREVGFRCGCVTGASAFDCGGVATFEEFVAGLPSRSRRHYGLTEERVTLVGVPLASNVDRIVELEAQTAVKNGGTPDITTLRAARSLMAELMPHSVRVMGAMLDGKLVACAIWLVGSGGCNMLAYGCDYSISGRSIAYYQLTFDEPIAHCIANGIPACRLGFEAFHPKRQRGARVERREMWLWLPDEDLLDRVDALLRFVTDRNSNYLRTYGA